MTNMNSDRPAARAFMELTEDDDAFESGPSSLRRLVIGLMTVGAIATPFVWAASADADDSAQAPAAISKSLGDDDGDDDDNSGPGGDDNTTTGLGGATDRGGDTSANGEDTAGTTAGTGASATDQDSADTGLGGATDRGGDTSANGEDTAGTTAGTGASATDQD